MPANHKQVRVGMFEQMLFYSSLSVFMAEKFMPEDNVIMSFMTSTVGQPIWPPQGELPRTTTMHINPLNLLSLARLAAENGWEVLGKV